LDIPALYKDLAELMKTSQECWPADGPKDGDAPNYAGLFGRLAWHCSGTFRHAQDGLPAWGGCEGGAIRFFPESEWRDNDNLDQARALLADIKRKYRNKLSWGDLMTFAGAVGIKESGGPVKKFCFGRVDAPDGKKSIQLGRSKTASCDAENDPDCVSDGPCQDYFRWPRQDESDHFRCNFTQTKQGRHQASHSVGLIYVYPEGPMMKNTDPEFDPNLEHNRMASLSAEEVRDTFAKRMGWSDQETVAIIAGGHTLGRCHGASGGGGKGPSTLTSGFEGPWTTTPSKWSYEYLDGLFNHEWGPSKSPVGNDQWWTTDRTGKYANTMRLTSDIALKVDPTYRSIAEEYLNDHDKFDSDFADAWFKLVHRSAEHPGKDDLENDAGVCTDFSFL